jgi:hypothetical protein
MCPQESGAIFELSEFDRDASGRAAKSCFDHPCRQTPNVVLTCFPFCPDAQRFPGGMAFSGASRAARQGLFAADQTSQSGEFDANAQIVVRRRGTSHLDSRATLMSVMGGVCSVVVFLAAAGAALGASHLPAAAQSAPANGGAAELKPLYMAAMSGVLSEEDIKGLAAHYASRKPRPWCSSPVPSS